jgi:hypothetical protein
VVVVRDVALLAAGAWEVPDDEPDRAVLLALPADFVADEPELELDDLAAACGYAANTSAT